jgi:hypothetical protein
VKSKATIQPFATKKIMADDSNEEETQSQPTRQSTRNEGSNGSYKRGAYRGNRNDKNSLQGNIAELGNSVYQYRTRDQGDRFTSRSTRRWFFTSSCDNFLNRLTGFKLACTFAVQRGHKYHFQKMVSVVPSSML